MWWKLLHFRDIAFVRERVRRRRGAQRMNAKPVNFGADARIFAVFKDDVATDRRRI